MEPRTADLLLTDPLTAITRQARTRLIAFSGLAVVIEKTGLIPTQIEWLGISFAANHRIYLIVILLIAVAYLLLAFLIYAFSDFSKWQLALRTSILREKAIENRAALFDGLDVAASDQNPVPKEMSLREEAARAKLDKVLNDAMRRYMRPWLQAAGILGGLRAILEFILPVALGIYAVCLLDNLLGAF